MGLLDLWLVDFIRHAVTLLSISHDLQGRDPFYTHLTQFHIIAPSWNNTYLNILESSSQVSQRKRDWLDPLQMPFVASANGVICSFDGTILSEVAHRCSRWELKGKELSSMRTHTCRVYRQAQDFAVAMLRRAGLWKPFHWKGLRLYGSLL